MPEIIHATGHEHVSGTHDSTLEVTTDEYLTPAGDCILGINADHAPADFTQEFTANCQDPATSITISLEAEGIQEVITGQGHPDLSLTSERSFVARTSSYVDERTICVNADAAAADVDRALIDALQAEAPLTVKIRAEM